MCSMPKGVECPTVERFSIVRFVSKPSFAGLSLDVRVRVLRYAQCGTPVLPVVKPTQTADFTLLSGWDVSFLFVAYMHTV